VLPEPTLNFSPNGTTPPPFPSATPPSILALVEPSLETTDLNLLTTGASGASNTFTLPDPDTRVENFSALPNGPFPLEGRSLPYDSYTGDSTHRLFEMWQQSDCNIKNATAKIRLAASAISILSSLPITPTRSIPSSIILRPSTTTAAETPWRFTTYRTAMLPS